MRQAVYAGTAGLAATADGKNAKSTAKPAAGDEAMREAGEATGEVCEIFAGTVVASIVIICSSQQ